MKSEHKQIAMYNFRRVLLVNSALNSLFEALFESSGQNAINVNNRGMCIIDKVFISVDLKDCKDEE